MEAALEPKQFGRFAMLPSRSATSAWALHCLAPSQRGRVPPSHLVSVLWHDLLALPLSPHQQKYLLLMSEASEDPRPDSCLKLSTHSLSYGTWDSTIKDRCFQVQEAFQYSQVLCGSIGALRGGALTPHLSEPERGILCSDPFWAVPGWSQALPQARGGRTEGG